jgi:hypothetical protein
VLNDGAKRWTNAQNTSACIVFRTSLDTQRKARGQLPAQEILDMTSSANNSRTSPNGAGLPNMRKELKVYTKEQWSNLKDWVNSLDAQWDAREEDEDGGASGQVDLANLFRQDEGKPFSLLRAALGNLVSHSDYKVVAGSAYWSAKAQSTLEHLQQNRQWDGSLETILCTAFGIRGKIGTLALFIPAKENLDEDWASVKTPISSFQLDVGGTLLRQETATDRRKKASLTTPQDIDTAAQIWQALLVSFWGDAVLRYTAPVIDAVQSMWQRTQGDLAAMLKVMSTAILSFSTSLDKCLRQASATSTTAPYGFFLGPILEANLVFLAPNWLATKGTKTAADGLFKSQQVTAKAVQKTGLEMQAKYVQLQTRFTAMEAQNKKRGAATATAHPSPQQPKQPKTPRKPKNGGGTPGAAQGTPAPAPAPSPAPRTQQQGMIPAPTASKLTNKAAVEAAITAAGYNTLNEALTAHGRKATGKCFWISDPIGLANGPKCPFTGNCRSPPTGH